MKKRLSIILTAAAATFAVFFVSTTPTPVSAAASSDAFESFHADYTLSKVPGTNTSHLEISETIVDEYAAAGVTSHVIDRVIPARMKIGNGRSWSLNLNFLTASGGPHVDQNLDSDALFVSIGDWDNYLHGKQTFRINYTATDVVRPDQLLANKVTDEQGNEIQSDEFHWMVNGDASEQAFLNVTAKVTVAADLVSSLDGRVACWNNELEDECKIASANLPDGSKQLTFTGLTTTESLKSLVFDIGFRPDTFAMPAHIDNESFNPRTVIVFLLLFLLPILAYIIHKTYIISHNSRKVKSTPIIPQFVAPPKTLANLSECEVFWNDKNLAAPLLLDLAINGFITLSADEKGKPSGIIYQKPSNDTIEDPSERALLEALFEGKSIGDQISLKSLKSSRSFGKKIYKLQTSLYDAEFDEGGFFLGKKPSRFTLADLYTGIFVSVSTSIVLFMFFPFFGKKTTDGQDMPLITDVVGIGSLLAVIFASIYRIINNLGTHHLTRSKKLTDRGADLFRHLSGLKEFMTVSEADRIKMLQSVKGAEKINYRIHLYERLLPFATIFGIEKSWGNVLETYYTEVDSTPNFYSGFVHGYAWSSALSSFSSSTHAISRAEASRIARSAMSRSSSWSSGGSSSSGFSGGGGSFGGGGGSVGRR